LQIYNTHSNWNQVFKYQGERIINCHKGTAVEVTRDGEG
jgi:hypothetical protein